MSKIALISLAFAIGCLITIQLAANTELSRRSESVLGAVVITVVVNLLFLMGALLIHRPSINYGALSSAPWWVWIGGIISAVFTAGSIWLAPQLGAALVFASLVAGQLTMAVVADHFAIMNLAERSAEPARVIGIVLVLSGVWLVSRA